MIEFVRASGAGTSQKSKDVEEELPQPQYSLFSRDEVGPRRVGRGLHNLGNTCFFNSVLQILVYTGPLQRFLLSKQHTAECKRKRESTVCTLCLLESHALEVFDSNKAPIKPAELLKHMLQIASRSKAGRQEDAHEFLIHFLDSCPQHVSLSFSHLLHFLVKSCCKFPGIEVSGTPTWGLCLSCQVPQISAETGSAATSSNASAEFSEGSL